LYPTATNNPELFTVTDCILAPTELPFISAGVVHVEPLLEVAYSGTELLLLYPTATNSPELLTVMDCILATTELPFISTGVVQVPDNATAVTEFEALDALLVPMELVAVTVNVYAVLVLNPLTFIDPLPACDTDPVIPLGELVAVYLVIG
jgi:hypothetical protein